MVLWYSRLPTSHVPPVSEMGREPVSRQHILQVISAESATDGVSHRNAYEGAYFLRQIMQDEPAECLRDHSGTWPQVYLPLAWDRKPLEYSAS